MTVNNHSLKRRQDLRMKMEHSRLIVRCLILMNLLEILRTKRKRNLRNFRLKNMRDNENLLKFISAYNKDINIDNFIS